VEVGGATTVTDWVVLVDAHKPLVGVTVKPTLYVPGVFHTVEAVPVPVAEVGVPDWKVHAPVPVEPPVYVKLAVCPEQIIEGTLKLALAEPPILTSNVS
jgi:hypothetical protein